MKSCLGDETNIEAETTEAENKNPKGAGRKPKVTDRSEKKIMDAWASGRYKTHGDIDYEFELEKGEAKKVIERVNRRLKRSGQRTE